MSREYGWWLCPGCDLHRRQMNGSQKYWCSCGWEGDRDELLMGQGLYPFVPPSHPYGIPTPKVVDQVMQIGGQRRWEML